MSTPAKSCLKKEGAPRKAPPRSIQFAPNVAVWSGIPYEIESWEQSIEQQYGWDYDPYRKMYYREIDALLPPDDDDDEENLASMVVDMTAEWMAEIMEDQEGESIENFTDTPAERGNEAMSRTTNSIYLYKQDRNPEDLFSGFDNAPVEEEQIKLEEQELLKQWEEIQKMEEELSILEEEEELSRRRKRTEEEQERKETEEKKGEVKNQAEKSDGVYPKAHEGTTEALPPVVKPALVDKPAQQNLQARDGNPGAEHKAASLPGNTSRTPTNLGSGKAPGISPNAPHVKPTNHSAPNGAQDTSAQCVPSSSSVTQPTPVSFRTQGGPAGVSRAMSTATPPHAGRPRPASLKSTTSILPPKTAADSTPQPKPHSNIPSRSQTPSRPKPTNVPPPGRTPRPRGPATPAPRASIPPSRTPTGPPLRRTNENVAISPQRAPPTALPLGKQPQAKPLNAQGNKREDTPSISGNARPPARRPARRPVSRPTQPVSSGKPAENTKTPQDMQTNGFDAAKFAALHSIESRKEKRLSFINLANNTKNLKERFEQGGNV